MISVEQALQQAMDLCDQGDPGRSIMIMTTPFRLGCLVLHLAIYAETMKRTENVEELTRALERIQDDLQKVVTQILQQEYPQS